MAALSPSPQARRPQCARRGASSRGAGTSMSSAAASARTGTPISPSRESTSNCTKRGDSLLEFAAPWKSASCAASSASRASLRADDQAAGNRKMGWARSQARGPPDRSSISRTSKQRRKCGSGRDQPLTRISPPSRSGASKRQSQADRRRRPHGRGNGALDPEPVHQAEHVVRPSARRSPPRAGRGRFGRFRADRR